MTPQADEFSPISIDGQGIDVTKILDDKTFNQELAIRLTIESQYTNPVEIRILDQFPDDFDADNIGFHPDYHRDNWEIHDGQYVVFSTTIDPEETIDTLYIAGNYTDFELDAFLTDPQVIEADEQLQNASETTDITSDAEPDQDTTEQTDDTDTNTDETASESSETIETDESPPKPPAPSPPDVTTQESQDSEDLSSPLEANTDTNADQTQTKLTETSDQTSEDSDSDPVATTLAAELNNDAVDDETIETLATIIGEHVEADGAPEARLQHLESRVSELEAYSATLETFLNDADTTDLGAQLTEFHESLIELEQRIETIEDTSEDQSATDIQEQLADIQADIDELLSWRNAMTSAFDQ